LVSASVAATASLAVLAVSSAWIPFLTAVFVVGLAGGLLDAGVNAHVAVHRGARAMGIIHTGFGIGSTLGPLLVTLLISVGWSWRVAFLVLAAAELILALAFMATVSALESKGRESGSRPSVGKHGLVLTLSLAVFFLYAGIAAGTGAWSFSLLTEGRGISTGVAGVAVAAYWGGVTAGRVALGVFGNRIDPNRVLTMSAVGTVVSLALLWIAPTPWLGIVGLVASGLSHGFVFPLEVLLTPQRFGAGFTPWAVGYEIAAANVGVAVVSGTIGLLVGARGIAIVAPALVVLALLLWVAIEALRIQSIPLSAAAKE
jgi:fucose permease